MNHGLHQEEEEEEGENGSAKDNRKLNITDNHQILGKLLINNRNKKILRLIVEIFDKQETS